jgi:uncharacterized cupin superfamily protein
MAYRVLPAADAFWRPSNQMGVLNTDLAKQLGAATLGARLWRLAPGQASTRHRHAGQDELYVLLEGRGRVRVEAELLTLDPLSALYVEADTVWQIFNDTGHDVLWLVVGAPPEAANTRDDRRAARRPLPGRTKSAAPRAVLSVASREKR